MGDGEMDEPESLGAISLAGRESLDNLVFVINCNLQRLDGPVRGNGKIIQELESVFRGAGWNVIKVHLGQRLGRAARARTRAACCCSAWRSASTASTRTSRARAAPTCASTSSASTTRLQALVADMSDDEIWGLTRGGHDPREGVRRLRRGRQAQGPADGDPAQDRQGLRHGRIGRRPDDRAPGQEDDAGRAARLSRPLPDPGVRRASCRTCPSSSCPTTARR